MRTGKNAPQGDAGVNRNDGASGSKKTSLYQMWGKGFSGTSFLIAMGGGVAGFTSEAGFSQLRITLIVLAAIVAVILAGTAAVFYMKDPRPISTSRPVAAGLGLLILTAGSVIGYLLHTAPGTPAAHPPITPVASVASEEAVTSAPASQSPPATSSPTPTPSTQPPPPNGSTAPTPSASQQPHKPPRSETVSEPARPAHTLTDADSTSVAAVAFSPDGKTVVCADVNGNVFLYKTATGRAITSIPSPDRLGVWAVSVNSAGTMIAGGTGRNYSYDDGSVYVWSTGPGNRVIASKKDPDGGAVETVAFSPVNSRLLAWSDNKGMVYIWNLASGVSTSVRVFAASSGEYINGLAFSRDGARLAGAGHDGGAYVWTVATGQPFGGPRYGTNSQGVNGVAFSPDGSLLAAADSNGTIDLWDLASGSAAPAATFTAPSRAAVQGVVFTPDGKTLIATAFSRPADATISFWNVTSRAHDGKPLQDPASAGLSQPAITKDGATLAVGDGNAHGYLWNLSWLPS